MSSTTTQKTEIPDPSPQEQAIMDMISQGLMPAALDEAGFETTRTEERYEDTQDYKRFNDRKSNLQKEMDSLQDEYANADQLGGNRFNRMPWQRRQQISQRINNVQNQINKINEEEDEFLQDYKPEVKITTRKKDSVEVEAMRKKLLSQGVTERGLEYHEGFQELKGKYEKKEIDKAKMLDKLQDSWMKKTQKYLDGDFSITKKQKQQIKDRLAPQAAALDKMFKTARKEVDRTEASLFKETRKQFDAYEKRVQETGMNVHQALEATGARIMKTGEEMESALSNTIEVHKELLKMGIEDYTGELTKATAINAARIGRTSDDPEFQKEMQDSVSRFVTKGGLNLAAMEAQGMLGIKERTGGGLEDIERGKGALAERTGSAMEQSALARGQQRVGIAERAGMAREELVRGRGAADVGLAEAQSNAEWQMGAGMVPSMVGLGQGVSQYQNAMAQQRIANAQNAMQMPMGVQNMMARERFAEPTVTSRTTQSLGGSIFGGLMGAVGAGSQMYGGIAAGQAMGGMSDWFRQNMPTNPYAKTGN